MSDDKEINQRFLSLFSGVSQKQLMEQFAVSQSTVSDWFTGRRRIPWDKLEWVVVNKGVSWDWLLTGYGPVPGAPDRENNFPAEVTALEQPFSLPVVGLAACDVSGWFNTSPVAIRAPLPTKHQHQEHLFAVIALGTSMQPDGIREGNLLFCDPLTIPRQNDAVYVKTTDGRATIKRFLKNDASWLYLLGWLDPEPNGQQKPFTIKQSVETVETIATVVMIQRHA